MIVLDIEASGTDFVKNGIWQIGAIDIDNPKIQFLDECRIDDEDSCTEEALRVIGKTEKYLREKKQSQQRLIEKFFSWCKRSKTKNFICQGPQFDIGILKTKAEKYNLKYPFHWRAFDLHSVACLKYYQLHKKLLLDTDHSGMSLSYILEFCGMKDNRKSHNALEDAKLTAECFSRIVYAKKFLDEFERYPMPKYLK